MEDNIITIESIVRSFFCGASIRCDTTMVWVSQWHLGGEEGWRRGPLSCGWIRADVVRNELSGPV
jgi:hypothetical protein